jgi:2-polyprenyl-3-methyl-5-hydroxy-6-metoxy-1,4-benzoquinol methylase
VSDQATASAPVPGDDLPPDVRHRLALRTYRQRFHGQLAASHKKNRYFHQCIHHLLSHHVLPGTSVLEIGCGNGDLLAALAPSMGVGVDIDSVSVEEARRSYPHLTFHETAVEDIASLNLPRFDYIICSGVLQELYDLHTALRAIRPLCHAGTRIIFCTYSRLWTPLLRLAELLGRKFATPDESWLPRDELMNLLSQNGMEVVRQTPAVIAPMGVPIVSGAMNRWMAPLPGVRQLGLSLLTVARLAGVPEGQSVPASISIVAPVRNEAGNIQALISRLPMMAENQELIFVEGHSTDETWQAVQQAVAVYQGPMKLMAMQQKGRGKGDAVRQGFAAATGEILMILDGDLSVPPEELPRFVQALVENHCEFANGSRLIYPMEDQAMQFLNMIANKCFGILFSYLLGQRLRDTLCGTKVLWREDYQRIAANRGYFGDFDPFGDFDLLFGAARLNLKIRDIPVHYKQRTYGSTNISRFRHGLMLSRMCMFAARKITFI